jgi:L-asparaginase/Glu-tRNA(Gln) amidotransferase subunit D
MTTQEIYKLANEMTEQQVLNIIAGWENINEYKSIEKYNILVRLGDSMQLACVTVIAEKINNNVDSEIYRIAYES